eukprot:5088401-Lingulodinium_polyedra.AAC.1
MQKDDQGEDRCIVGFVGGSEDHCASVESDVGLLRGATPTREFGGVPIAQDSVLVAAQSVNERCLKEMRQPRAA